MKKVVYLYEYATGVKSEIDVIDANADYSAADYFNDCIHNGVVWYDGKYGWDYLFILEGVD